MNLNDEIEWISLIFLSQLLTTINQFRKYQNLVKKEFLLNNKFLCQKFCHIIQAPIKQKHSIPPQINQFNPSHPEISPQPNIKMHQSQIKDSFPSTQDQIKYKLIMVGDSCVGKSALFQKFIYGDQSGNQTTKVTTIDFNTKDVYLRQQRESVKLFIWDTAGQERYRCIVSTYFKGCHGVLLVFDLNDPKSFQNAKSQWLPQIKRKAQTATIILIGNKSDLTQRVDEQQVLNFARENKLVYLKTSVKSNFNVKESFQKLTRMVNSKRDMMERRQTFSIKDNKKQITVKKRNCCRQH